MTPEEKSLLERTYKLSEENHQILVSIRRSARISMALRILYWALIVLFSLGAYYFIQPYLLSLMGAVGGAQGSTNIFGTISQAHDAASQLQDLLK